MSAHSAKTAASWIILTLIIMQFIPLERINPPEDNPLTAPADIVVILKKSCYDCHSYQTKWPAPAYIAPISWAANAKVAAGRRALNFSRWRDRDSKAAALRMHAIRKTVFDGTIHEQLYYSWKPLSRLTEEERIVLLKWVDNYGREQQTGFKNSGNTLQDKSF
ncbi:MAG: heme-binding domain-containing protein [Chlorobium limicola]|jgi:hypothetical protein|nr:heme-binding domain-containing protein [Chlorobium limicola]